MRKIASFEGIEICLTKHAQGRCRQRNVDTGKVAAMVIQLGKEKLASLIGEDIIIVAPCYDTSVVCGVEEKRVRVITVVAKASKLTFHADLDKIRLEIK